MAGNTATDLREHQEMPAFNDTLSPQERLRLVSNRLASARGNDLGVGYHVDKSGEASLVFTDLEGRGLVSVPTSLSREGFDKVMGRVLPLDETKFMLYELAKAYDQRTPIMLEGGTAIGKTYTVNLFAKLIYGEKAKIPDFYCNGQTDVSELMGKYVPAGIKPEEQARLTRYLESEAGQVLKAEILKETGGKYETKELYIRAAAALGIPIDKSSFEFQLGVLPKAMTAGFTHDGLLHYGPDGPGVMLHIQEVGMAAPSVVNALLQIRGEQGRLAESIQVWQDGGREVVSGPGFFAVFSTNPPGKGFQERFEVDKALARALVWVNLPDKLADESLRKAAGKVFSFADVPPQHETIIDMRKNPELGEVIGGLMAKFHQTYTQMLGSGEQGRKQKIPATLDSMWRVAELIQEVQMISQDGTAVDMVTTLREAVKGIYINCLQDKPDVVRSRDMRGVKDESLGGKILAAFDEHLNNATTDSVDFRGSRVTRAQAIKILTKEAMSGGGQATAAVAEQRAVDRAEHVADINKIGQQLKSIKDSSPSAYSTMHRQLTAGLSDEQKQRLEKVLSA